MKQKTILILTSNPSDTVRLRLDKEVREIDEGLRRAKRREQFVLQQKLAVRPLDIYRAILDYEPQFVHFSGHGAGEQGICFEDDNGQRHLTSTEALSELFALFQNIECVFLNACYSERQANEIVKYIRYVVGMNEELKDETGITFAVAFYDALGAGKSVEFSFNLACAALRLAGVSGKLIPVLKIGKNSAPTIIDRELPHPRHNTSISALQVQFPHTITYDVSRQERKVQVGRIELKNSGNQEIPAGCRGKLVLLRPIDFRVTLVDTIVLPAIWPGIIVPIDPFTADVPRDIARSEDKWHLELYVIDPQGNEMLLFRSSSISFV